MFQHKLVIDTNSAQLETRVNTFAADGWQVLVGSIGGIFSGSRNERMIVWAILEKEIVP
jgi:hypothetical protein